MTVNLTKARVQEALKNIEDTPLGKAFIYWITQELHRSMDDILDFQINMDDTPNIAMSVTFLPETRTTTMQRNDVRGFGIPNVEVTPEHALSITDELDRLVFDACMMLNMEADGQITRQEYEKWRDTWVKQAEVVLAERQVNHATAQEATN